MTVGSKDIDQLFGQSIAMQALLVVLCKALIDAGLKVQIEKALANADRAIEIGAIESGPSAKIHHMQASLAAIEAVRNAIFDQPVGPKNQV